MRHLDLSFEGKHLAERTQLDNGKLPHGGHRGTKRHPPSHLSHDKGREFQQRLEEELSRVMEYEEMTKHGGSPAWSILVHNSPSYTDESPLITNNLLAASKLEQMQGVSIYNRTSLLPKKAPNPLLKSGSLAYYRPNRMHQYLSATELKNNASSDVNVKYGRPTRTTLLRARQRSNSAPSNQLEKKRDFSQRLDDVKTAPAGTSVNTDYLQLQSVRDGESLHSYLTGARYNRAHCLDSKSVDHNGVYLPRHNPALGSFFSGPKGQEYLQEMADSPRADWPTPPSPPSAKRRPLTAPSYGRRPVPAPPTPKPEFTGSSKYKYLKLNIIGSRLPLVGTREPVQPSTRLPRLTEGNALSDRRLEDALDQTYLVNQPPLPSPPAFVGDSSPPGRLGRLLEAERARENPPEPDSSRPPFDKADLSPGGYGDMRVEGKSTLRTVKVKAAAGEDSVSVPTVSAEEKGGKPVEEEEDDDDVDDKDKDTVEGIKEDAAEAGITPDGDGPAQSDIAAHPEVETTEHAPAGVKDAGEPEGRAETAEEEAIVEEDQIHSRIEPEAAETQEQGETEERDVQEEGQKPSEEPEVLGPVPPNVEGADHTEEEEKEEKEKEEQVHETVEVAADDTAQPDSDGVRFFITEDGAVPDTGHGGDVTKDDAAPDTRHGDDVTEDDAVLDTGNVGDVTEDGAVPLSGDGGDTLASEDH